MMNIRKDVMKETTIEWSIKIVSLLLVGVMWTILAIETRQYIFGFIGLAILYRRLSKMLEEEAE